MKFASTIAGGLAALTLIATAAPASAQHRYYDQRRDNSGDVVAGIVIGAIAGGLIASASSDNDRDGCGYYRDGRCWRNQGHWEREHGINSRYGYSYGNGYNDRRNDWRDDRRDRGRYDDGRRGRDRDRNWRNY